MYDDDKIRFLHDCSRGPETAPERDARLGRLHLKKGEWDKSMSYLTAAIVFEPDNGGYWLDLGRALLGMGDSQLARDAWHAGLAWSRHANDETLAAELEASIATLPNANVAV